MVEGEKIIIKDTGKNTPNGDIVFTQQNGGTWIEVPSGSLTFEFTTVSTNYESMLIDDATGYFKPQSNEVSSVLPLRITLRGLVEATDTPTLTNLINLQRSRGLKLLSGGMGVINAMPNTVEETYFSEVRKCIYVIVKNVTMSEIVRNSANYVNITIQLEHVEQ